MKKRIKLKKKKQTKKKTLKIIAHLCLILFITLTIFSFKNSMNHVKLNSNDTVNSILYEANHNINYSYSRKKIINNILKFLSNITMDNPSSIISSNYYSLTDEEYAINSDYIEDPTPNENLKNPIIYIYNTHQLEEYKKSNTEDYNVTPNTMMASYILREKLNKNNLPTIVEVGDVSEILRTNNWQYYKSYDVTRMLINDAKEKNKSLRYFIDLHRDSISRDLTTLKTNDKTFAKVLFIVGLENKNYEKNMQFMDSICIKMNNRYNGICKGLYKKQGEGVNGVYNQDIDENVVLIEVGGVDNTIDEVSNTLEVFSSSLKEYIGEKK